MYSIALICENGASTGMLVRRMVAAAREQGIDVEVKAYPYCQLDDVLLAFDYVLFGPQLKFRLARAKEEHPDYAERMGVVESRHFAMMNGKAILDQAITAIDALGA